MIFGGLCKLCWNHFVSRSISENLYIFVSLVPVIFPPSIISGPLPIQHDGMDSTYRKVSLAGQPILDSMPHEISDSDSEPEESLVDPLTLRLQNRTTDVYIPIGSDDLNIIVARNLVGAVWVKESGLTPAMKPDLPFGNCWTSGLASNVHLVNRGETSIVEAIVTDEEGTIHRFAAPSGKSPRNYIPLPNTLSQQPFALLTLVEENPGEFVFTRKRGTKLKFEATPTVRIMSESASGAEQHVYYRLASVSDRFGTTIDYHYHELNDSLVPNEISFHSQTVKIFRNKLGRVNRIIDPTGNFVLYDYEKPAQPGGAPLLVRRIKQITGVTRAQAVYGFDEFSDKTAEGRKIHHCNVSEITGKKINTYRFDYYRPGKSDSRLKKLRVKSVMLPPKFGTVRFESLPAFLDYPGKLTRRTFVADAEGNGVLYQFHGCSTKEIMSGEELLATIDVYDSHSLTYFDGNNYRGDGKTGEVEAIGDSKILGTETYRFDLGAGISLKEAESMGGHTTKFLYEDKIPTDRFGDGVSHPFVERYSAPTAWITPLEEKTVFEYSNIFRIKTKTTDALGRISVTDVSTPLEKAVSKRTYANAVDYSMDLPFNLTEFKYENDEFPGFETWKAVRKTAATPEELPWEVDLVESYEADSLGRLETLHFDPDGEDYQIVRAYDRNGNLRSRNHSSGYRIDFKYDGFNRLTGVFSPSSGPNRINTKRVYGEKGLQILFEEDGTVYEYDYNSMGNTVKSTTFPPGKYPDQPDDPIESKFNSTGSKVAGIDDGGFRFNAKHDGLQRVTLMDYDDDTTIEYGYEKEFGDNLFDSSSSDVATSDYSEDSFITINRYNPNGKLIEKVQKSKKGGEILSKKYFEYDAVGNLKKVTDSEEGVTKHFYDVLNRNIKTEHPDGKISRTLYTSTGLKYATIEPDGDRTDTEYDSLGDAVE